jgi:hypothetical protein
MRSLCKVDSTHDVLGLVGIASLEQLVTPGRVAMPTRRQSIVLGAASVFAPNLVRTASINAWPDRTVHMVVPNAAGGPTDVNVRTVAEQLSLTSAMPLWPTPILMVIHCYSVPHPLRRMALYLARSITVVKSRHWGRCDRCPLYPQKQTSLNTVVMSALCRKRTHALQQKAVACYVCWALVRISRRRSKLSAGQTPLRS